MSEKLLKAYEQTESEIAARRGTESERNRFIANFLPALAAGTVGLIVEYWTGLFSPSERLSEAVIGFFFIVNIMLVVLGLVFFLRSLWVLSRPYRFVREEFALPAVLTTLCAIICSFVSLVTLRTPWYICTTLYQAIVARLSNVDTFLEAPAIGFGDCLAILAIPIVTALSLARMYHSWNGLQSESDSVRVARGAFPNIWSDAASELTRVTKGQPPVMVHVESPRQFGPAIVSDAQSLRPWKEQALDLLELSSTNYSFDVRNAWHEPPGCWLGQNRMGEHVMLYPSTTMPTDSDLKSAITYCSRVEDNSGRRRSEIIVISRENVDLEARRVAGRVIRIESEDSMINSLLNLDEYRRGIRRRVEEENLPESHLTILDSYVQPRVALPAKQLPGHPESFEEYLLHWLEVPGRQQVILLGEYGQGKSTAALMFTYKQLIRDVSGKARIPILIELRGTSPATSRSELGWLGDWSAVYNINPKLLHYLNESGRLLLIFEGFDEMSLLGDSELRRRHFARLWAFATPKAKILLTGRPNLFRGTDEMEQALGLNKPIGITAYGEAVRLKFFTVEQISEALRNYPAIVSTQICDLATRNPYFRDLVSRPSLLHVTAVLWEQEQLVDRIYELNSAYVLDLFVRKSYRRPGRKDDPASEYMILNSNERAYFMHGIAAYMVSQGLPNQIDGRQLDAVIDELIDVMPLNVSTSVPATSGETGTPLAHRFWEIESIAPRRFGHNNQGMSREAREQVKTDVRTCGLLVDDPSVPGTFRFAYKLFMEFLFSIVISDYYKGQAGFRSDQASAILNYTGVRLDNLLDPSMTACPAFFAESLIADELRTFRSSSPETLPDKGRGDQLLAENLLRIAAGLHPSRRIAHCRRLNHLRPIARVGLFIGLGQMVAISFFLLMSVFIPLSALRLGRPQPAPFFIAGLAVVSLLVFLAVLMLWVDNHSRTLFWTRLCRRLAIPEKTMHQVIGTYPFLRNKEAPFHYFERGIMAKLAVGLFASNRNQ